MNPEQTPHPVVPKESTIKETHTTERDGNVYDVYKLIQLAESLPEEIISTASLEDLQENNYWHDTNGEWVGPHHILALVEGLLGSLDWENLKNTHPHLKKILTRLQNADYSYPILLVGDDTVIDGKTEIKVKKFSNLPEEAILRKD